MQKTKLAIYLLSISYTQISWADWVRLDLPTLSVPFGSSVITHFEDGRYLYAQSGSLYTQNQWSQSEFSEYAHEPEGIDPSFVAIFAQSLGALGSGGFAPSSIYTFDPNQQGAPEYQDIGVRIQNFHGIAWDSKSLLTGGADTGPSGNRHGIRYLTLDGLINQILVDDISTFSTGFVLDPAGNLYVGDNDDGRVYRFERSILTEAIRSGEPLAITDGQFIHDFGEGGNIGSLAIDGLGRIWGAGFLQIGLKMYDPIFDQEATIIPGPENNHYRVVSFIRRGVPYVAYTNQEDPFNGNTKQSYGFDPAANHGAYQPFIAYNDLSWEVGQASENITLYTTKEHVGTTPHGHEGSLIDYNTGAPVNTTVTISGGLWHSLVHARQGSLPNEGTDAFDTFHGIVDARGVISYGRSDIVIDFSGLNPNLRYRLLLLGNRGQKQYLDRRTRATLAGVAHMENRSSVGADFIGIYDESTVIPNGYNTRNGYLARFENIDPGADGKIRATLSGEDNSGPGRPYINAFCLEEVLPEKKIVTQIEISRAGKIAKDLKEVRKGEALQVTFCDLDANPLHMPLVRVRAAVSQRLTTEEGYLTFLSSSGCFEGELSLEQFDEGKAEVTIHAASGESATETIFFRKSTILIL